MYVLMCCASLYVCIALEAQGEPRGGPRKAQGGPKEGPGRAPTGMTSLAEKVLQKPGTDWDDKPGKPRLVIPVRFGVLNLSVGPAEGGIYKVAEFKLGAS